MNDTEEIVTHDYLKEYLGDRLTVEGRLQCYSEYFDPAVMRKVSSVLMREVDLINNGASWSLSNHIYVGYSEPIRASGCESGDIIRMDVMVHRYHKKANGSGFRVEVFGLKEPRDVEIVRKAERRTEPIPAPAPAEPPKVEPAPEPEPPPVTQVETHAEPLTHTNGRKPHQCRFCGGKAHGPVPCPMKPKEPVPIEDTPPAAALAFDIRYQCLLDVLALVDKHGFEKVARAVEAARVLEDSQS